MNICVVGLGYVGLPLAIAFAEKGFNVIGFDLRVRDLAKKCAEQFVAARKELGYPLLKK